MLRSRYPMQITAAKPRALPVGEGGPMQSIGTGGGQRDLRADIGEVSYLTQP